jgi:hypothetical protein
MSSGVYSRPLLDFGCDTLCRSPQIQKRSSMTDDLHLPAFGEADSLDDDTYGVDCRADMQFRTDSIAAVSLVSVTRTDDVPMGAGDLVVSPATIVPVGASVALPDGPHVVNETEAGMFFTFRATGGIAGATYRVKWAERLHSGLTINRTSTLAVRAVVDEHRATATGGASGDRHGGGTDRCDCRRSDDQRTVSRCGAAASAAVAGVGGGEA